MKPAGQCLGRNSAQIVRLPTVTGLRRSAAPRLGRLARQISKRQIDDALDGFGCRRGLAKRAGVICHAADRHALEQEAYQPAPDDWLRQTTSAHDLRHDASIGGDNDAGAPRALWWYVAISNDPIKMRSIPGASSTTTPCSHIRITDHITSLWNPSNASFH
jgi:hypothetical protein